MNNLTMRFLLTALTSMVCFAASAYSCKIDGVCYNVQNSDLTASVTYSGYPYNNEYTGHYHSSDKLTGDLQIPATITYNEVEYTVTAIADYAFYDAESTIGITSVTIPSTVTSIGRAAFFKTSLSAVTVEWDTPLSLSSNNSTFPNLANITLYVPSGSKAAYESADYWKGFKEIVEMPAPSPAIEFADANVKALCVANWDTNGDGELSEAEAAAVTALGEVFAGIGIKSFDELRYFTGITSINCGAFYGCRALTSVSLPSSVKRIENQAFYDCSGLTSIDIPSNLTTIGEESFSGAGLTSVIIPSSVTFIDKKAFIGCSDLCNIVLQKGLERIGDAAFDCCVLTSVAIPSSVKSIGISAFGDYFGTLESIVVEEGNAKYDSRNNCNAIIESSSNTLVSGCMNTLIPSSVTTIGEAAFSGCRFSAIDIPGSVTTINDYAFENCGLSSVMIPSSVNRIGNCSFRNCKSLTSVEISEGVKSIGGDAFWGCTYLSSITMPLSVVSMGGCAFDETAWYKNQPSGLVYIGKIAYRYKGTISSFSADRDIIIKDGTLGIAGSAFTACRELKSVYIPSSVESIGNMAFYLCDNLIKVTVNTEIPVSIASNTFWDYDNATLYVPYGCKAAYETADYWKNFKEIVEMESASLEMTDISQTDYAVYVENTEAFTGRQATLSVKMKNAAAVQTIQFDLCLPEGVSVVDNEDGELVTASKERIKKFNYFNSSRQADGAIRLLAQATTTNVAAGDGEICTVTINIPDDMAEGEYPLIVKNAMLVEQDNTSHSPEPNLVQSKLTVWAYIPGDANGDGEINAIDFNIIGNLILGYSQTGVNEKAADINGDGEVNAIDFNMVGNIILNGSGAAARETRAEEEKDPA